MKKAELNQKSRLDSSGSLKNMKKIDVMFFIWVKNYFFSMNATRGFLSVSRRHSTILKNVLTRHTKEGKKLIIHTLGQKIGLLEFSRAFTGLDLKDFRVLTNWLWRYSKNVLTSGGILMPKKPFEATNVIFWNNFFWQKVLPYFPSFNNLHISIDHYINKQLFWSKEAGNN